MFDGHVVLPFPAQGNPAMPIVGLLRSRVMLLDVIREREKRLADVIQIMQLEKNTNIITLYHVALMFNFIRS